MGHVAGSQAFLEPADTLGRGAMSEGFGRDSAACLFLQIVVTNLLSCIDSLLKVALLERAKHLVLIVSPHAGIKIGQQLDAHADLVLLLLRDARHAAMSIVKRAKQVLHVMPHFVRDDVCIREVATGSE